MRTWPPRRMRSAKVRFITFEEVIPHFRGKTVALVGSGPSQLDNQPGFVDSHEVVVRINNYQLGRAQGYRCDVHYSFYGSSVRKRPEQMRRDGVRLCMCKCPNDKPIHCDWHERRGRIHGTDFRYIYRHREHFWFCDTYIPTSESFLEKFNLLGGHVPTTGFTAVLDILSCSPKRLYITGFDFFTSGIHNVNQRWTPGKTDDPIGHDHEAEAAWLATNAGRYPFQFDNRLAAILAARGKAAA